MKNKRLCIMNVCLHFFLKILHAILIKSLTVTESFTKSMDEFLPLSDMITCMSVYGARERLPVSTCLSSLVPSRASMGYSSSSINPFTPQRANIFNVTQLHSGAALFSTGLCSFLMTGRSWESFSRPSTTGICWLPDLFGPSDQTLQDQTFL